MVHNRWKGILYKAFQQVKFQKSSLKFFTHHNIKSVGMPKLKKILIFWHQAYIQTDVKLRNSIFISQKFILFNMIDNYLLFQIPITWTRIDKHTVQNFLYIVTGNMKENTTKLVSGKEKRLYLSFVRKFFETKKYKRKFQLC